MTILGSQTHTFTRRAPGTDVDGDYIPGATSSVDVVGSLQPLKPRQIKALVDGGRPRADFIFYTHGQLQLEDPTAQTVGDELVINGRRLVVVGLDDWSAALAGSSIQHRAYLLAEEQH